MLNKPKNDKPLDPEDRLTGVCPSCKLIAAVYRWQARPPMEERGFDRQPGTWNDLWTCPCEKCGAAVYVHKMKPEIRLDEDKAKA